jgi:hypothetical protein
VVLVFQDNAKMPRIRTPNGVNRTRYAFGEAKNLKGPKLMTPNVVRRTFLEFGADGNSVRETSFVGQGRCIARTYRADNYTARWIIGEDIIEFFDASNNLLREVSLLEEVEKQAA